MRYFKDKLTICLDAKQIIVAEVGDLILLPSGPKSSECRSSTDRPTAKSIRYFSAPLAENQHKELTLAIMRHNKKL